MSFPFAPGYDPKGPAGRAVSGADGTVTHQRLGAERPQLVVVDRLALSTPLDPYLSLRALAAYSGCSVRWLRAKLTDPHHPLPCYRLPGGKLLVRRSTWDVWIAQYAQHGHPTVNRVVADVLGGLTGPR